MKPTIDTTSTGKPAWSTPVTRASNAVARTTTTPSSNRAGMNRRPRIVQVGLQPFRRDRCPPAMIRSERRISALNAAVTMPRYVATQPSRNSSSGVMTVAGRASRRRPAIVAPPFPHGQ